MFFVTPQVFKLYLFSRSVISFVETLEAYFEGDDKTVDEAVETLIKEKFVSGFKKLTEGFSLFQQVRTNKPTCCTVYNICIYIYIYDSTAHVFFCYYTAFVSF